MGRDSFTVRFDHLNEVVFVTHSGEFELSGIGEMWNMLFETKEFVLDNYGLLVDYRDAKFKFELDEVDTILPFFQKNEKILRGKREAVLVDNPYTTAVTYYVQRSLDFKLGFQIEVFNTEEKALQWLGDTLLYQKAKQH